MNSYYLDDTKLFVVVNKITGEKLDFYKFLGVDKNASEKEIEFMYNVKLRSLEYKKEFTYDNSLQADVLDEIKSCLLNEDEKNREKYRETYNRRLDRIMGNFQNHKLTKGSIGKKIRNLKKFKGKYMYVTIGALTLAVAIAIGATNVNINEINIEKRSNSSSSSEKTDDTPNYIDEDLSNTYMFKYVTKYGDSMHGLKNSFDAVSISGLNGEDYGSNLPSGVTLLVFTKNEGIFNKYNSIYEESKKGEEPTGYESYVIKQGDVLPEIANRYGVTCDQIRKYNLNVGSGPNYKINAGDTINIPVYENEITRVK